MDDNELLLPLLKVCQRAALWLLDHNHQVPPHVYTVSKDGTVSEPWFPHDHLESANWSELLEGAAAYAREQAAVGDVIAVAVSVELENDGQRGVGIQAETSNQTVCQILPFEPQESDHRFHEPLVPDPPLFDRLFGAPTS